MMEKITELIKRWAKSDIRNGIAVLYVFIVLGNMTILSYHPVPAENKDLINVLGGHVFAGLGLVLAYYFGSSKSEKTKNEDE
jgi:hypothetical protein